MTETTKRKKRTAGWYEIEADHGTYTIERMYSAAYTGYGWYVYKPRCKVAETVHETLGDAVAWVQDDIDDPPFPRGGEWGPSE